MGDVVDSDDEAPDLVLPEVSTETPKEIETMQCDDISPVPVTLLTGWLGSRSFDATRRFNVPPT